MIYKQSILWFALVALVSGCVASARTPSPVSSPERGAATSRTEEVVGTFERKIEALGCKAEGTRLREEHVFTCVEKIRGLSTEELQSLNKSLLSGDSAESQIMNRLEEEIKGVSTIVLDPTIKDKATRLNRLFQTYREGDADKGIPAMGDLVTEITRRSNRIKLTTYLVAVMQMKHQLAVQEWEKTKKGTKPQAPPVEALIAQATSLVDIVAMEGCLRGVALPNFREERVEDAHRPGRLTPAGTTLRNETNLLSRIAGEYACSDNRYIEWSRMDKALRGYGLDNLVWFPNQKVVLLDDKEDFDVRAALLTGNYKQLPKQFQAFLPQDNLRRAKNPYAWTWMWGFYDDAIGMQYAKLFAGQTDTAVSREGRLMRAKQDIQLFMDMNLLDSEDHMKTGKLLVPHTEVSRIARRFQFQSDVVLGKKYGLGNIGYGMHKKGMILDGRYFITGGRNFGLFYTDHWRDTDVFIAGDVSQAAAEQFYQEAELLKKSRGMSRYLDRRDADRDNKAFFDALARQDSEDVVALVTHEPALAQVDEDAPSADKIYSIHLDMLRRAKAGTTVYIENAYIILTPPLRTAITDALKRGVSFQIYTNSPLSADEPVVSMPIMLSVRELLEMNRAGGSDAGRRGTITIKLRRARYDGGKMPSTLHSKFMLVETDAGPMALIGSYNLHPRSLRYEEEMMVVVKSPSSRSGAYKQLLDWFNRTDSLVSDQRINSGLPDAVNLTEPEAIALLLPENNSWANLRALPEGGLPEDGLFAFLNTGVAAAMTIGFEQL